MADQGNAAAKVEAVFAAVAKGDASDTDSLLALGDAIVPAVSGYLTSPDEKVRGEAVAVLAALPSDAAATALLPALSDSSAAIRERAARGVLAQVLKSGAMDGLGAAAANGLAAGEPGAALLLLGGFSPQARKALNDAAGATRLVKLTDAELPVAARLPAQLALARLGDAPARSALVDTIARDDLAELLFLLAALPLIDEPSLLHALAARTLDDQRTVGGGVPAGAEPARRLADRAVDALASRLRLELPFQLNATRRYSDAEIAAVRKAVGSSIPN